MIDRRNQPAVVASLVIAAGVFAVLWLVGLLPLLAWLAAWTVAAFAMYGYDKRQADQAGWRVPEALLHGLALIGGVVGAWAGRAVFRHKTQVMTFTVVLVIASFLWGIIAFRALIL